jgi:uncharacterized protein (DUF697 family)
VIVSCVAVAALVGRIVATICRALVEIVAPSGGLRAIAVSVAAIGGFAGCIWIAEAALGQCSRGYCTRTVYRISANVVNA